MTTLFLLLMIAFAIFSLQTDRLRRAIVYLCVFSLLCSICYLLYQAPDVAIAEAVIGSTLSTVLYLVALKKYKIFRVYYTYKGRHKTNTSFIMNEKSKFESSLQKFAKEKELEVDMIITTHSIEQIHDQYPYDLIIEHKDDGFVIYGEKSNYHYDEIMDYINNNLQTNKSIQYACLTQAEGDIS